MCHLAGALVIHSVAEDAFWLLTGMMETVLKEYYDTSGPEIRVDAGVFDVVLRGSEKDLATTFKQLGIRCACSCPFLSFASSLHPGRCRPVSASQMMN